jgi:hypothetical protein
MAAGKGKPRYVAALPLLGGLLLGSIAAHNAADVQAAILPPACSVAQAGAFKPPEQILLDPTGRVRVFAMHHKQCLDDAASYQTIYDSLDVEIKAHVDPWRATDHPNLVVFNELTALIYGTEGTRGMAARQGSAEATLVDQFIGQEGAAGIGTVAGHYALPLSYYEARFGPTSGIPGTVERLFTAITDTMVRASVETSSRLARTHGVYLLMDAPLPVLEGNACTGRYQGWVACPGWTSSTDPAAVAALTDPDLNVSSSCAGVAQTPCVYVAQTPVIDNVALMFAPDGSLYDLQPKVSLTGTELNPLGWNQASPATIHAIGFFGADAAKFSDIKMGIGISLDAFEHSITSGDPCAQPRDSHGTFDYFMQCLDSKGVNLFLQPEFNSASDSCMSWTDFSEAGTGAGGCNPGSWQPVGWMHSSWFAVQGRNPDGSFVHKNFRYAVNPFLIGNLFDVAGDGQSAIFARDDSRAHTGWYAGDSSAQLYANPALGYVDHADEAYLAPFEGPKPGFLVLTAWTMPEGSPNSLYRTKSGQSLGTTDSLQACERGLGPGSGFTTAPCAENSYRPSALVADLFLSRPSTLGATPNTAPGDAAPPAALLLALGAAILLAASRRGTRA